MVSLYDHNPRSNCTSAEKGLEIQRQILGDCIEQMYAQSPKDPNPATSELRRSYCAWRTIQVLEGLNMADCCPLPVNSRIRPVVDGGDRPVSGILC
jgi:hypothetical protein